MGLRNTPGIDASLHSTNIAGSRFSQKGLFVALLGPKRLRRAPHSVQ